MIYTNFIDSLTERNIDEITRTIYKIFKYDDNLRDSYGVITKN